MISLRTTCLCVFLLSFFQLNANAQLESAKLKPYIFFSYSNDSPEDHNYGAFHYTNVHRTLPPEMVGAYYQSGLFHTWYRPVKIYGQKDFSREKYGYHAMEGGAGYKPYLRFRTDDMPLQIHDRRGGGWFWLFFQWTRSRSSLVQAYAEYANSRLGKEPRPLRGGSIEQPTVVPARWRRVRIGH